MAEFLELDKNETKGCVLVPFFEIVGVEEVEGNPDYCSVVYTKKMGQIKTLHKYEKIRACISFKNPIREPETKKA